MALPAVTRFGWVPLRLPNGELLMDARHDGRAYGTYDHEMRMEYEEDEQGEPAVDGFGRRVVAGADPWAPVRHVTCDLRRWVNAVQLPPGRVLRAYFDILYDEGEDFEAAVNDGRWGASRHAKRLGGRQLTGGYVVALEAELRQAIEDPDEDTPSGSIDPPTKLRMFVKVDGEEVDEIELVVTQPARRGRPGASHEERREEREKRRGGTASGRAPPGQRRPRQRGVRRDVRPPAGRQGAARGGQGDAHRGVPPGRGNVSGRARCKRRAGR